MTNIAGRTASVSGEVSFEMDPDELVDFSLDWTSRMTDTEHITNSTWLRVDKVALQFDLIKTDEHIDVETARITTIWLRGGTLGRVYKITNHVTTDEGRQMECTMTLTIKSR